MAKPVVVDDNRLLKAQVDSSNWLSHGRDYSNQRFSPLRQINRDNVKRLAPAWTFKSGVSSTFQTTPIVVDGVMYLSLPFNHVVALDARTGKELWRYEHKRRTEKMCCGPANRGVAVAYGKVFLGTVDARLIALDQNNGKPLWDIPLVADLDGATEKTDQLGADDPNRNARVSGSTGVGANMAPLVYPDRYPESPLLDTGACVACGNALIASHMATMSSCRCRPSHRVCVPGWPSPLRPRKPPSVATLRIISRKVGT